jgi:solute carrier family 50 (sugar transporter)
MDAQTILLEYLCPALGCVVGTIMFLAPYSDLKHAIAVRGTLGDLNPTPWAFMLGNCAGWITYAVLRHDFWIFLGNAPGLWLSVWLNMGAAKLQYQEHRSKELKQAIRTLLNEQCATQTNDANPPSSLPDHDDHYNNDKDKADKQCNNTQKTQQVKDLATKVWTTVSSSQNSPAPAPHETLVMSMVLFWVTIIAVVTLGTTWLTLTTRELLVGLLVNLNLVFFYGAPLSTIRTVLQTRNSASIHYKTMGTNTANSIFWGTYGVAVGDPFVYVPNGVGAALGVVQLILCLTVPRRPLMMMTAAAGEVGDGNADAGNSDSNDEPTSNSRTSMLTLLQAKEENAAQRDMEKSSTREFSDSSPDDEIQKLHV